MICFFTSLKRRSRVHHKSILLEKVTNYQHTITLHHLLKLLSGANNGNGVDDTWKKQQLSLRISQMTFQRNYILSRAIVLQIVEDVLTAGQSVRDKKIVQQNFTFKQHFWSTLFFHSISSTEFTTMSITITQWCCHTESFKTKQ